jgi:hypothetical protein
MAVGCDSPAGQGGDGDLAGGGGFVDGGDLPDGGFRGSCGANGDVCTTGAGCCSGSCDPMTMTCTSVGGMCATAGMPCNVPTDCCNNTCVGGTCSATQCKSTGESCVADLDCCTVSCAGGTCQPIVSGGCVTLGNNCAQNAECCSNLCSGGKCVGAGGPTSCLATGDICFRGLDCCTGLCNIPSGESAGTCGALPTSSVGGCKVAGDSCSAGTDCCSRVCAATATGGHVCQVTTGCRLKGELCRTNADCCGGAMNGQCGDGTVVCEPIPGTSPTLGRCSTPTSGGGGVPFGVACGGGDTSTRQNCCCDTTPKQNCCFPDVTGVYRCGRTMCVPTGGICTFSAECCDNAPCVPDASGVLRCGAQCVPSGGKCTANGDCCVGLACIIPPGALSGTCATPITPPPDGGTTATDMATTPMCALLGQSCAANSCCPNNGDCKDSIGELCTTSKPDCTCQAGIL